MPFRTTISAVLWTDTVDQAQDQIAAVKAAVVDEAQDQVLATIEHQDERPPSPGEIVRAGGNGQSE